MRMLSFMKRDRLSEKLQSSIFGMEEVYPVHVAAYFGDDDAMDFMIASRADPNKKTSMGRTALAVAREFNTCGILPQKVSSDSFVTFESLKYFMIWYHIYILDMILDMISLISVTWCRPRAGRTSLGYGFVVLFWPDPKRQGSHDRFIAMLITQSEP